MIDSYESDDEYHKFQELLDKIFRRWMWKIFLILNKDTRNILKSINDDDEYNYDPADDIIDLDLEFGPEMWDEFSFASADEIKRIMPEANLNGTDFVNNKSGIDSLIDSN